MMKPTQKQTAAEPDLYSGFQSKGQDKGSFITSMDEKVFHSTRVFSPPGPEFSDELRKFQGIPGMEVDVRGGLWAVWYGGGVTEDRHNHVLLATSTDRGENWKQVLVVDPDGDGPMRAFDPFLWRDPLGRLWLFWNQKLCNLREEFSEELERRWYLWGMCATWPDGSKQPVWSEPQRFCEGVVMNKPTVLSTGEWLVCSSDWGWDWSARVFRSTDQGKSWHHWGRAHVPDKSQRSFDEHMVVERRDGLLWMLVRTKYGIGESFSHDRGRTWGYVQPSSIAHVCSRFHIGRLRSGRMLLIKHGDAIDQVPERNPGGSSRSHLTAFLSEDDGRTWSSGLLLDERWTISYPDAAQAEDGTLFVTYDWNRKLDKEILLARITEDDILAGKLVSPDSRLRLLVNKARGMQPSADV